MKNILIKKMYRILVVEDEESLLLALKDNLEAEDCVIDTAENGEEAMVQIRKHAPDIILLDLLMAKRDGLYVLGEVKKDKKWKSIPVIVLSNVDYDTEIKHTLEMGASEYYVKSQHMIVEVMMKVREYLDGKKPTIAHSISGKDTVFRILDAKGDFINSQTKLRP